MATADPQDSLRDILRKSVEWQINCNAMGDAIANGSSPETRGSCLAQEDILAGRQTTLPPENASRVAYFVNILNEGLYKDNSGLPKWGPCIFVEIGRAREDGGVMSSYSPQNIPPEATGHASTSAMYLDALVILKGMGVTPDPRMSWLSLQRQTHYALSAFYRPTSGPAKLS